MKRTLITLILVCLLTLSAGIIAQTAKTPAVKTKPALLVIDIQNAFLPYMSEQDKKFAMEAINYFIALFRQYGFPVIRIYHSDPMRGPKEGSEEFAFPKSVAVQDSDPMVVKNFGNAFKKTGLDKMLKEKGVNALFLCGLSSTGCVLATYHGAYDNDYPVFMIQGALIGPDSELTQAVQKICQTIDYSALKLLLENCRD